MIKKIKLKKMVPSFHHRKKKSKATSPTLNQSTSSKPFLLRNQNNQIQIPETLDDKFIVFLLAAKGWVVVNK